MPNCPQCKNDFPRLDKNTEACGKCTARKPGMSIAEYAMINVRNLISVATEKKTVENIALERISLSAAPVD